MDYTSVDWTTCALIVIDVQQDFVAGAMPAPGTSDVLDGVSRLVELFREAGRPIVHAIRLYQPGGSDVDPVRRDAVEQGLAVVAPGSAGAEIPAVVTGGSTVQLDAASLLAGEPQHLGADEAIIYKPRWSAFFRTQLQAWLTARGVTSIVVAGCNLPNCPRATLFDATERDFRAAVVTDAVSQVTAERLADLELIGVQTLTVADAIQHLA